MPTSDNHLPVNSEVEKSINLATIDPPGRIMVLFIVACAAAMWILMAIGIAQATDLSESLKLQGDQSAKVQRLVESITSFSALLAVVIALSIDLIVMAMLSKIDGGQFSRLGILVIACLACALLAFGSQIWTDWNLFIVVVFFVVVLIVRGFSYMPAELRAKV